MEGFKAKTHAKLSGISRQTTVLVAAKHVHRSKTSHNKRKAKNRDIRTSFINSPGAPMLVPPPLVTVGLPPGWGPQQQVPAAEPLTTSLADDQQQSIVLPLSSRAAAEPIVALTAVVPAPASAANSSDLDAIDSVPAMPPLAALDNILDGLIVAPSAATYVSSISTSVSSASPSSASKSSSSSRSKRSKRLNSNAAAAGPAVTLIQCEVDWERELAAAAAHDQLVVVKVESSCNPLLRPTTDPTLRFQTNRVLPTPLNTYLPHADSSTSLASNFSSNSTLSALGINLGPASTQQAQLVGTAATGSTLGSLDTSFSRHSLLPNVGADPFASLGLYGMPSSPIASSSVCGSTVSSASSSIRLDSPVHQWYLNLAGQYAESSSSQGLAYGKLKFLSLQSDGPRAKALCRKLGVSECLSVLLVDPSSGRKVLEVCGTKIEQELPSGLMYFADVAPDGRHPSDVLPSISSNAEFESIRSKPGVSVVAFHMHAAPPCIKTFGFLHQAATRQAACGVSFAQMDITWSAEHSDLAADLDLQRLPTYIVYRDGKEVARLARTSERKKLNEVLQDVLQTSAVAAA